MSTAAVFLDIEKAFDTTWHPGLLYKLSNLKFSASLIILISSFLCRRRNFHAKVYASKGAIRFRTISYSVQFYINDTPKLQV
jgi:hypothetical protein